MSNTISQATARQYLHGLGFQDVTPEVRQILGAADTAAVRRPTARLEPLGPEWSGRDQSTQVDRFSLNPFTEYFQATVLGFTGSPPDFFASGALPPITGSGVPPEQLASVAWVWRHSAAMSPSRVFVLELIERSQDPVLDVDRLQTPEGHHALADAWARARNWALMMPGPAPMTDAEIDSLFPSNTLGG